MKLNRDQTIALIACVLLVASAGAYWFMFVRMSELQVNIADARSELARLTAQKDAHASLVRFLEGSAADTEELNRHLLSIDNPSPFLALIEETARDAGVVVDVETLEVASAGEGGAGQEEARKYLRLVLMVSGSWRAVYHFVALVEHLPYVTRVDRMAVELDEGVWNGQITLHTLVQE